MTTQSHTYKKSQKTSLLTLLIATASIAGISSPLHALPSLIPQSPLKTQNEITKNEGRKKTISLNQTAEKGENPIKLAAEFTPNPKTENLKELVRNIQIEISRTLPAASGSNQALSDNQHWMEYSFPRYQKYGAIHFIKTNKGILSLSLEKPPKTTPEAWEKQKETLKNITIQKNGEITHKETTLPLSEIL
jgi:hypothetical protein